LLTAALFHRSIGLLSTPMSKRLSLAVKKVWNDFLLFDIRQFGRKEPLFIRGVMFIIQTKYILKAQNYESA